MEMRPHRSGGKVHQAADFLVGPSFHIVQQDDFPPYFRYLPKCVEQPVAELAAFRVPAGVGLVESLADRVEPKGSRRRRVTEEVPGMTVDNFPEPCAEFRGVAAVINVFNRINEGIMGKVLCRHDVIDHRQGHDPAAFEVTLGQLARRLAAALPDQIDEIRVTTCPDAHSIWQSRGAKC